MTASIVKSSKKNSTPSKKRNPLRKFQIFLLFLRNIKYGHKDDPIIQILITLYINKMVYIVLLINKKIIVTKFNRIQKCEFYHFMFLSGK